MRLGRRVGPFLQGQVAQAIDDGIERCDDRHGVDGKKQNNAARCKMLHVARARMTECSSAGPATSFIPVQSCIGVAGGFELDGSYFSFFFVSSPPPLVIPCTRLSRLPENSPATIYCTKHRWSTTWPWHIGFWPGPQVHTHLFTPLRPSRSTAASPSGCLLYIWSCRKEEGRTACPRLPSLI